MSAADLQGEYVVEARIDPFAGLRALAPVLGDVPDQTSNEERWQLVYPACIAAIRGVDPGTPEAGRLLDVLDHIALWAWRDCADGIASAHLQMLILHAVCGDRDAPDDELPELMVMRRPGT